MEFKINISDPKNGKTHKKVLNDADCKPLIGKKIGDTIKGETLGFAGYEFKISGGSDSCGFPMRWDVSGTMRKRILITTGVGIRSKRKGMRKRKTVAANQIYAKTAQINLTVTKAGKGPIDAEAKKEDAGDAKEAPKDAATEKKAEAVKEERPKDAEDKKPEDKKEDKKTEKKEEPKKEKVEKKDAKEEKPKKEEKKVEDKKNAPKTEDNKKEEKK
ncbi:MAG: 30S ribosomal protein S6e [Nanoarchaeota archaeon]|nr:30S ribosomal protein S6e [Nanoarchaeota archaeon]